jgi:type I restriction enzyme S subunit
MSNDYLNELPARWAHSSLGDVCSQPQYGFTTSSASSGNLKLVRTTDITSGEICWESVPFCSENPSDEEKYLLEDGDIVISRAGSVGVSYLLKNPPRSVFASYLIRFKPLLNRQYFKFFLESPYYWHEIEGNKLGIAVPNVNASKLKEILIPIPPEKEQSRIVAKIEELFSELDKGIENLKTAQAQLKVYRQALLKNAFEGKLTTRADWREMMLGDLLGFLTSGSRGWAPYYATSGDLFVRAQNIKHDYLELDDIAFVSLPDKAEGLRTLIQQGDLLITITGANVTKAALVKHELGTAYVSQHVALCRPTVEILPEFLYWFIVAEAAGRKQLTDMAYGAGKPGLNLENIRSVKVSVPSLSEQKEIISLIEEKLSETDQLDESITTSLRQSEALRQSILKKAFSGQLVRQNPNDEPALALLARIKAKKDAQPTSKKARK